MTKILKIHNRDRDPIYFVDGERCEAYDDTDLLYTLFGDDLEELYLASSQHEDDAIAVSMIESALTRQQVDDILALHPQIAVDIDV